MNVSYAVRQLGQAGAGPGLRALLSRLADPMAAEQTELLRALARHGVEFVVVGGGAPYVHE